MKDYVVYHNPDSMGTGVENVNPFAIVTDKQVADTSGDRVWLITGEGSPRTFLLRSYFVVDEIGSDADFKTRLSGKVGRVFSPMVELNAEEWFPDFKRSQQNFRFGLQAITDGRFVRGLEAMAARR